jgi:hypothetical protein
MHASFIATLHWAQGDNSLYSLRIFLHLNHQYGYLKKFTSTNFNCKESCALVVIVTLSLVYPELVEGKGCCKRPDNFFKTPYLSKLHQFIRQLIINMGFWKSPAFYVSVLFHILQTQNRILLRA